MECLPLNHRTCPLERRYPTRMSPQNLCRITDRRQWIAQLVSEHREEFVFLVIDVLQGLFSLAPLSYIHTDTDDQTGLLVIDASGACMNPALPTSRMTVAILSL